MKVAITAQGKDLQSAVDLRFGRASWFVLVDLDTGEYQAIGNDQNVGLAQGAGIQSAGNVARHAPAYLITGHCEIPRHSADGSRPIEGCPGPKSILITDHQEDLTQGGGLLGP